MQQNETETTIKKNSKNESVKLAVVLLISCSVPLIMSSVMGKSPYVSNPAILYVFWALINFLFITAVQELFSKYFKLFKLKNLKTNKISFFINFFVYAAFIVFINLYFLQQLYIRDNAVINKLTDVNALFMLLLLFIFNLYCGQAPDEEVKDNLRSYSMNKKSSIKLGREKFGVLVGEFDDGFTIGSFPFYFSDIKTVYTDKKTDALVIKGKDDEGNFRINIEVPKSKEALQDILLQAEKDSKIVNGKINM